MIPELKRRARSRGGPIATFRTSWQMLNLLDNLAELEGNSRGRILNAALLQYAEDYLTARGRVAPDLLRNSLRRMAILQQRIEIDLQQRRKDAPEELQENRQDALREAYRYARYVRNSGSCQLLSKMAGWLIHTYGNGSPPEIQTSELKALLQALLNYHETQADTSRGENGPK